MLEFYLLIVSSTCSVTSVPSVLIFLHMNIKSFSCALFLYVALTQAHGDHSHEPDSGDPAQYAQRHVRVQLVHLSVLMSIATRWQRSIICTQARRITLGLKSDAL